MRSSAIFLVRVVTSERPPASDALWMRSMRSSICPVVGWITTSGSTRPVGRMTWSTTWRRDLELVGAGGGRQEDHLAHLVGELVEGEGAVVEGRGQAEAVLHQGLLAGPVTLVLAVDLGDGHVALVDDGEEVRGEEVEQGVGRLARAAAVEVAAVVLDAVAHPHLGQHLEVVLGPQPQALGLEQLARPSAARPAAGRARPRSTAMARRMVSSPAT